MADLNEVRLIGRLTRDPELRSTPGGQYVCTLGLATGRRYKGPDNVMREETTFVDITCWGKLAENVSKYMKKGRLIFIGGRLKYDTWDDKQTGQKRSKLTVVAENVQFLDRKDEGMAAMDAPVMEQGYSDPSQWGNAPGQWAPPAAQNMPPKSLPNPAAPPTWDEPEMGEPPF